MEIQLIIVTLLFCAFFSGIEIAYITSNRLKLELLKKQGTFTGRMLGFTTTSPSRFLATTLVGNNIALIVLGLSMAKLLEPIIGAHLPQSINNEFVVMILQTLITTL